MPNNTKFLDDASEIKVISFKKENSIWIWITILLIISSVIVYLT